MNGGRWVRGINDRWVWEGDQPPVFMEPTPLQKLVVRALTLAMIIVIPLGAVFVVNRNQTNNRVSDNKAAIAREAEVRRAGTKSAAALALHFNRVNQWAAFDGCVADEQQDAIIVKLLMKVSPRPLPDPIQEAIDALEPEHGDRVCIPPRGERPKEAQP